MLLRHPVKSTADMILIFSGRERERERVRTAQQQLIFETQKGKERALYSGIQFLSGFQIFIQF